MRLNKQPIEKRITAYSAGNTDLDVHSIFYTIQGEGPFCGTPAVFIRLAGCNLQCPQCDTDYTQGRQKMSIDRICQLVQLRYIQHLTGPVCPPSEITGKETFKHFTGLVVITGGEPFRQDIELLVLNLQQRFGCYVQVETNGVLPPPQISTLTTDVSKRSGLYIVCSPKAGKVNMITAQHACAFKYVMGAHSIDPEDGLPIYALDNSLGNLRVARPPSWWKGPIYLQPLDEQSPILNRRHMEACVESCLRFGYTLQLQVHKIVNLE